MPRLSLWHSGYKKNDYNFFDNTIKEMYYVGGTAVYVHKYIGPLPQDTTAANGAEVRPPDDLSQPVTSETLNQTLNAQAPATQIQDVFYLENRDRNYDPNIYELRAVYTLNDIDYDLKQFGIFLANDTIFITFHISDMVQLMGRKIMSGDVLELPHNRELYPLDPTKPAINKFYVVQDATWAAEGYSQTWFPHIWRCKSIPLTNQQEFYDILYNQPLNDIHGNPITPGTDTGGAANAGEGTDGQTLGGDGSNAGNLANIDDAWVAEANKRVPLRFYTTYQLYLFPDRCEVKDPLNPLFAKWNAEHPPWLAFGDGTIPNDGYPTATGTSFPENPKEGDYFLRTDYYPEALFQRQHGYWLRIEYNWRTPWTSAPQLLETFINDERTVTDADGNTRKERQYLSKVVLPKTDFP